MSSIRLRYAASIKQPGRNETLAFRPEYFSILTSTIRRIEILNQKNPNSTGESKELIERALKGLSQYIKEAPSLRRRHQPVYPSNRIDGDYGVRNISNWKLIPFQERIICVVTKNVLDAFEYGSMEDMLEWSIGEIKKNLPMAEEAYSSL